MPRSRVGAHVEAPVDRDLGPERGEGVDVRVEPPAPDHVAAGRRRERAAERAPGAARRGGTRRGCGGRAPRRARACGRCGVDADLVGAQSTGVGAEVDDQLHHRLDVPDARHVLEPHGLVASTQCREDRQRAVLVAGRTDGAGERSAALDHEGLHQRSGRACEGDDGGGIVAPLGADTRAGLGDAHPLHEERGAAAAMRSPSRPRRARTHAASARTRSSGARRAPPRLRLRDPPHARQAPAGRRPILREEGYPEEVIEAVLSHAEHLEMPRDTPLKKTLFACDELSGFVHACGLVRPDRARRARAEVGQEEAQAAVLRRGRAPRRGLRGRRAARARARRAHRERRRGAAADRARARAPHGGERA